MNAALAPALPKTLLARNIALLIVLVMLSQVCSLAVLLHYVQRPRVERTPRYFANYVKTLDALFDAAARQRARRAGGAPQRSQRNRRRARRTRTAAEPAAFLHRPISATCFSDACAQHLPADMPVRWQTEGGQRLWIRDARARRALLDRAADSRRRARRTASTRPSCSRSASPRWPRSPAI